MIIMIDCDYYRVKERQVTENDSDRVLLTCGTSELWLTGQDISHQFKIIPDRYLLFISDGRSFESILMIYLLSNDAQVLDAIELGQAYIDGDLDNIKMLNEKSIQFTYFNEDLLHLEVLDKPKRKLVSLPGARYLGSFFKKRYLDFKVFSS